MIDDLLVLGLAVLLAVPLAWAFRHLPGERWQFLAAVPGTRPGADGAWEGTNYTFYGLFVASSSLAGMLVFIFLLGALAVRPLAAVLIIAGLVTVTLPAAGMVARIVEKKRYTFTVGGASFIGLLLVPWLTLLVSRLLGGEAPVMPVLAAIGVGYAFGEGLGRLACISFGCCYGKPLDRVHPRLRRFVRPWAFVFRGPTKKIAYADGLDGRAVVPIQAVTSVIYLLSGLAGFHLALNGHLVPAFLCTIVVTQGWRFLSEFLRDDERGAQRVSAYQVMALIALAYGVALAVAFPCGPASAADLARGARALWNPGMLLFCQVLWLAIFLRTGRSRVTASRISFRVLRDRV